MAEPTELSWEAPPFISYERGKRWRYLIIGIMGLLGAILALAHLYPSAALMVLGGVALIVQAEEKARPLQVTLEQTGVRFGRHTYVYKQLRHFAILQDEEPVLLLDCKSPYSLPHTVVIRNYDPIEVRDFLGHYLPEARENVDTSFLRLNRLIGFS